MNNTLIATMVSLVQESQTEATLFDSIESAVRSAVTSATQTDFLTVDRKVVSIMDAVQQLADARAATVFTSIFSDGARMAGEYHE